MDAEQADLAQQIQAMEDWKEDLKRRRITFGPSSILVDSDEDEIEDALAFMPNSKSETDPPPFQDPAPCICPDLWCSSNFHTEKVIKVCRHKWILDNHGHKVCTHCERIFKTGPILGSCDHEWMRMLDVDVKICSKCEKEEYTPSLIKCLGYVPEL